MINIGLSSLYVICNTTASRPQRAFDAPDAAFTLVVVVHTHFIQWFISANNGLSLLCVLCSNNTASRPQRAFDALDAAFTLAFAFELLVNVAANGPRNFLRSGSGPGRPAGRPAIRHPSPPSRPVAHRPAHRPAHLPTCPPACPPTQPPNHLPAQPGPRRLAGSDLWPVCAGGEGGA